MLKTLTSRPILTRSLLNRKVVDSRLFKTTAATRQANPVSPDSESDLLRAQRKRRPVSPHLTIYQPQLTWYMSSAHRLTGVAMGGAFYLSALAYLIAPAFGHPIDTSSVISAFAAAPLSVKIATKSALAATFVFHASNGIRHLIWDAGKAVEIKGVYTTGYIVLATTALGTIYLVAK